MLSTTATSQIEINDKQLKINNNSEELLLETETPPIEINEIQEKTGENDKSYSINAPQIEIKEVQKKTIIRNNDFPSKTEIDAKLTYKTCQTLENKIDIMDTINNDLVQDTTERNNSDETINISDNSRIKSTQNEYYFSANFKLLFFFILSISCVLLLTVLLNKKNYINNSLDKAANYHKKKNYIKAFQYYQKYYEKTESMPEKVKTLYNMALCCYSNGDYSNSMNYFKNISTLDVNSFYSEIALFWTGVIYKKQGVFNKANEQFNNLIIKYPDNPMVIESYKNILEIKMKMNDWKNIIDICKTLLNFTEANIDGDIYYLIGLSYEKMGFSEAADKYYKIIIDNNNYDPKYVKLARQNLQNRVSLTNNIYDTMQKNIDYFIE